MSIAGLLITNRQKIRREWGKSDEEVAKDIQTVKDWLETQKHLPEIPTDNMIEFFLTNCKYSIEKTKQNLDMYYTVRDLLPEIYHGIHPYHNREDMEKAYAAATFVALPNLTPSLHRVSIMSFKSPNETADLRKLNAHALANFYEIRIHEDLAMGEVCIVDYRKASLGIMAQITPVHIKQCVFIFEKVQSNRLKEMHLLKPPVFMGKIISIFKSLLKTKLKERVLVHQSVEDLYKYIPQELLPTDYGGKEKSMEELDELWKKKFMEYSDRFEKLEKMTVNELLRSDALKNDELLGYYGNFKQIRLD